MISRSVALLLALSAPTSADAATAEWVFAAGFEGAWVGGYYVGYQRDLYPLAAVDFTALTHLMVGRAVPEADGNLNQSFDIDPVNGPQWALQTTTAAHAAGVKAVLMVGGAGAVAGWRGAASPDNRAAFVANLLDAMDSLGFDGLDLDWEPLESFDQADFTAVAAALRAQRPNMILTFPANWINANFAASPDPFFGAIAPLFDQINVMTYEMAGAYPGFASWHSSAIYGETPSTPSSVASGVDYYARAGVPRSKLGFGIGFYGTCWSGVTAPLQLGGAVLASDNAISYHNIVVDYFDAKLRLWDASAMAPYLSSAAPLGPIGCNFLSYEDAESIGAKGLFRDRYGVGGTIIWTIAEGHLPEQPIGLRDPLLSAIRTAFRPQH